MTLPGAPTSAKLAPVRAARTRHHIYVYDHIC